MAISRRDPPFSHQIVTNRRKATVIHTHPLHELYFLVNGETKYFVADEIFHLKPGDFIFIPREILHKTDSETCLHNERILLSFGDEMFAGEAALFDELNRTKIIHIPANKRYQVEELLYKIQAEYEREDIYHGILKKLYIQELIVLLCRLKYDFVPAKTESELLINSVAEFIRENFAQELTLAVLGKKFGLSASFLSRRFKEVSGMGINEYITNVRIHNAAQLLKQERLSVTEVAARCGYSDSNYFASVFKKIKGITPLKYARTLR